MNSGHQRTSIVAGVVTDIGSERRKSQVKISIRRPYILQAIDLEAEM